MRFKPMSFELFKRATLWLLGSKLHRVTVFISKRDVLRVTRTTYKRKGNRYFAHDVLDMRVCVGRPNYMERKYINKIHKPKFPEYYGQPLPKVKKNG